MDARFVRPHLYKNIMYKDIAFLFDLDGVLIDSEREYTRIWDKIDKAFPTGVRNFSTVIKGRTLPEILDTYFPRNRHGEVKAMLDAEEGNMHYEYLPGARETLDWLHRQGIKTALVTSSNEVKMRHLDEELPGLRAEFDAVVTADKVSHSKPHPEPYLKAAALLGMKPERCVVIEDSLQGVKAGKSAGALVVGLLTTLPEKVIAPWCDNTATDLSELDLEKTAAKLQV